MAFSENFEDVTADEWAALRRLLKMVRRDNRYVRQRLNAAYYLLGKEHVAITRAYDKAERKRVAKLRRMMGKELVQARMRRLADP